MGTMTGAGYAAILARLQTSELRNHCDEALRLELVQVQHRLHAAHVALQRLRAVGSAARALESEELVASREHSLLVDGVEETQTSLGRAVACLGASVGQRTPEVAPHVCCSCRHGHQQTPKTECEPLLTSPDAAALSPPRRPKFGVKRSLAKPSEPRRKLVVPRRRSPTPEPSRSPDPEGSSPSPEPESPTVEEPKKVEKPLVVNDTDVDVQVIEDDSDSEVKQEEGDIRVRLLQRVDACWPLATSLGALEMRQRRAADYADLVTRVCALFGVLLACDSEEMVSRSMRSVLVKARDSLAVAVSLLNLHDVTDSNAPMILALVRAVDAASAKHKNLQKHIAPFRDSLAEMEVALLTRPANIPQSTVTPKKKRSRAGK